jgi:D-sedoheptulose 7-phosphate isomerase
LEWKPQVQNIFTDLFHNYPALKACEEDILQSFRLLRDCYYQKGKILVCGNGGSAADSEHIVGELLKGFLQRRQVNNRFLEKLVKLFPDDGLELGNKIQEALPAISLTGQSAFSTAFSNDVSPDTVFAQQVYALGRQEDILFAISTSGNSTNVLNAIKISRAIGVKSIGLTGQEGGRLKRLCDAAICVPGTQTYRIQELHLPVYHALCAMLEAEFFMNS